MSVNRLWAMPIALVVAAIVVFAPSAGRDRKPPRIVAGALVDANGNFRADRVRLTYSEPVRHAVDRDGHYPFAITGYRVRSVGTANGRTLLVFLVEKGAPDGNAHPAIRYRRTVSKSVRDRAGNQALTQVFRAVRSHGHVPPASTLPSPAGPPPAPTQQDADHDGTVDGQDCAPKDASIHPGASDLPDLSVVDSNCDGIDGTETDAVFASPNGNDANPGTKAKPKREIQAAVDTVTAGTGRYALAAAGSYKHVKAVTGVGVYGGYDPNNWSRRSTALKSVVAGIPEGILADGATHVVLQLLSVQGSSGAASASAYGIRAISGSALTLQRVTVTAGPGASRGLGANGVRGADGSRGENTADTVCALGSGRPNTCGGKGGASAARTTGGEGGAGGEPGYFDGVSGGYGQPLTSGGSGGKNGDPGQPGGTGSDGKNGAPGAGGYGGKGVAVATDWAVGADGGGGIPGYPGSGGGGGGGGGGKPGILTDGDWGNGGGGGGGGGAGGGGGNGGLGGGGSFGVYLGDSIVAVESSSITAGNGAAGGNGGNGAPGGFGGARGYGGAKGVPEVGRGGRGGLGGKGGQGGGGGGGAGGPSIAIFKAGTSKAEVSDSKITTGAPGAGGLGGGPGSLAGQNGQPGIAADVYPKS